MTNEQQRKMLDCAAKACGKVIDKSFNPSFFNGSVIPYGQLVVINEQGGHSLWNSLTNPVDTAEMCARLEIDTRWHMGREAVECIHKQDAWPACRAFAKDHDNSRLKAWMFAATMCTAKIEGYTE